MSMSAAAAGSNDTAVNYIAQELVFGGKIKITLIQIGINYFEEKHYWKCLTHTREGDAIWID